ncbi:unnamed protein product [Miscanthus lutarioriparius]|uniref:Rx N-terminal domain-containing protein n=1 Tax=Miscanthus lutarioriparius TaxID=422564 RepID=A0A811QYK7_9POAL|nr:unnamed protein product [Miscanthus lutarioriparius]
MAGTAQGAMDLLLGRLSSVLLEEAQLLRGVHDDVEFIKDEMESMNGFLLDRWLWVIAIVRWQYQEDEYPLTRKVYEHPSMASCFHLKAWINGIEKYMKRKETLQCILDQLPALDDDHDHADKLVASDGDMDEEEAQLVKKLKNRLKGKRLQQLQHYKMKNVKGAEQSTGCCWRNIHERPIPIEYPEDSKYFMEMDYTEAFLELLHLEGFEGLKKHHLKDICNKVYQLKYLSIRNTDITELPKDIEKLRYLETLDIRQTKIWTLSSKAIVLPKLMHLLTGNVEHQRKDAATGSGGSANELVEVGRLKQLRKLGVVLRGKEARLGHFLRVIERLNECLCSLSLRIELTSSSETPDLNMEKIAFSPPKLLESLTINGTITGLPSWIKELHLLSKITLCGTSLMDNAIRSLGELSSLRCLRLWHKSYIEMRLTFKDDEF